jgi:hypothetical protein
MRIVFIHICVQIFAFFFIYTDVSYTKDFKNLSFCATKVNGNAELLPSFLRYLTFLFPDYTVFVETGTYLGKTAFNASHYFKEVHTIELSKELYKNALSLYSNSNISFYLGDSSVVLPLLLRRIDKKIILWLDGHYSGPHTAKGSNNTPIMQELDAIEKSGIKDSIILIDDIRIFLEGLPEAPHISQGYPTVDEVLKKLYTINPAYQIVFFGDILLVFPHELPIKISPGLQKITNCCLGIHDNNHYLFLDEEKEAVRQLVCVFNCSKYNQLQKYCEKQ